MVSPLDREMLEWPTAMKKDWRRIDRFEKR